MIRITELRLPLDHNEPALRAAVLGTQSRALSSLLPFSSRALTPRHAHKED